MGDPTHPEASEAESELQTVVRSLPPDLQFSVETILAHYCLWWRGDQVVARGHVTAVEPLLDRSDIPAVTKLLWYYAAVGLAFWDGDDDALRRLAEEARAFGHKWRLTARMAILPWIEAQAYAAHGDRAAAVAALHSYEQFSEAGAAPTICPACITCGQRWRSAPATRTRRCQRPLRPVPVPERSAMRGISGPSTPCWRWHGPSGVRGTHPQQELLGDLAWVCSTCTLIWHRHADGRVEDFVQGAGAPGPDRRPARPASVERHELRLSGTLANAAPGGRGAGDAGAGCALAPDSARRRLRP